MEDFHDAGEKHMMSNRTSNNNSMTICFAYKLLWLVYLNN